MTDQASIVRDAAVAVLIAQNTLAGPNVEAERVDSVESGDYPRIAVFADESAQMMNAAGGLPRFTVTLNLAVDLFVEHAQLADAVSDLDMLIGQVKDALFSDPGWVALAQTIASFRTVRAFERGKTIVGKAHMLITCNWQERFPPRLTTWLSGVDLRDGPQPTPPGAPITYAIGADLDVPTGT